MSKAPALADRVRNGGNPRVHSWLDGAPLRGRLLRCALGMATPWLTTCDSMWTQFREPNPINCLANPGICPEGQVCNSQTHLCRVPRLELVAGTIGGPGNADDVGENARFYGPAGVALDGVGNVYVYVADQDSHTIRRVVLSTGEVTTIAGTAGIKDKADGIGAAARFNQPSAVTVDGAGNLYVADYGNHSIRKVVLRDGTVTTIAGTPGVSGRTDGPLASAQFDGPVDLTIGAPSKLYVADNRNHAIRAVDLDTGTVSTLAGMMGMAGSKDETGQAARFNRPAALVADATGKLFVADTYNHTIRMVDLNSGIVSTIAGAAGMTGILDGPSSVSRFNYPVGVASDGAGNLYVADSQNSTIRKLVLSTGYVTTIAGAAGMMGSTDGTAAAARFSVANDVANDGAGNIYVADYKNHTIRKVVLSTGVVTTLAGKAPMTGGDDGMGTAARFNGPAGMAADGAGNIYVADIDNHTIRKIVASTGAVTTIAGTAGMKGIADGIGTAARFYGPAGVATDGTGNIYVADYYNQTIRQVALSTGAVTTIAGTAGKNGGADGTGTAATFYHPYGVALDGAGNLYVAELDNHTIRKIVLSTSVVTTLAGMAGQAGNSDGMGAAARFNGPCYMASDGAGLLYVADYYDHTIRSVVRSTGEVTTIAGMAHMPGSVDGATATARFNGPDGVAIDAAGHLYITDYDNHTIRRIELLNGVVTTVTTIAGMAGQGGVKLGMLPVRLNWPDGMVVLPTGEIFVATRAENAILGLR